MVAWLGARLTDGLTVLVRIEIAAILVHTVAEYSWSIANDFVIGVYCRCLETLSKIVFSSVAN